MSGVSSIAIPALVLGSLCLWRALCLVAIEVDSEDWWDLADVVAGAFAGLGAFAISSSAAVTVSVALLHAVAVGYGMVFACWYLSVWLEEETSAARPASLRPASERIWDTQLAALPWSPDRDGVRE